MKKLIVVRTRFEAIHKWEGCNIPLVSYLRQPHRHTFFVEVKWEVTHNNRDLEFITMKNKLNTFLTYLPFDLGNQSCEDICDRIHTEFPESVFVSVFEDNENGAEISYI